MQDNNNLNAKIIGPDCLDQAIFALKNSDVIGFPTETVYGLAGNAHSISAVAKIFAVKDRPLFDPLIVHVSKDWNTLQILDAKKIIDLSKISAATQQLAKILMDAFWPGPLTIILPRHPDMSDLVTSGLPHVAIRMPAHYVAQQILKESNLALAAPSANRFGRISPTTAEHVLCELGEKIPFIVDGGACSVGLESTVVSLDGKQLRILRPGKIGAQDLTNVLKDLDVTIAKGASAIDSTSTALQSPGTLASHYAPVTTLIMIDALAPLASQLADHLMTKRSAVALLLMSAEKTHLWQALKAQGANIISTECLSAKGDVVDAAQNLFGALRKLDSSGACLIIAEAPKSVDGLWHAIHDRLSRATGRSHDLR